MKYFFWMFFISLSAFSQAEEYTTYKDLYPNESYVRLQKNVVYKLKLVDDKIQVTKQTFEEDLYLDDSAKFNSKESLSYSSFVELEEISAATLNPSGNSYDVLKVEEFREKNDLDDTFYDDSKSLSFLYPDLKKGSKTQIDYTYNIKNPRFLSAFYFADYAPLINTKVSIIAEKDIELDFKYFNTDTLNINFEQKKKGRNIVYTWEAKNVNGFKYEERAPNFRTFLPHVVPVIRAYTSKEGTENVLKGVDDLYNWYYSLVKGVNKQPEDQELIDLVNELTANKSSDIEKVKAIYYWTQQNIKYIAFEYALGGFIPREANDVFRKKYGDCKDNSSILQKMLDIAGLEGHLTWIGTREIPYTYEEMPTPAVDNHMILSYIEGDDIYYLDATGRYIKIDYPTSFIQGKDALISYGPEEYKIKKVPIMPSYKSQTIDTNYLEIEDRNLIGKAKTYFTGYTLNDLYYSLERIDNDKDVTTFYKNRLIKGNNSFLISDFKEHNKFSYEEDFHIDYDFSIRNYVQQIDNEIFLNPHLNQEFTEFKTKDDRKYLVEFEYKSQYNYINIYQIPEGYEVEYLPENVEYSNDFINFSLNYTQKGNQIITRQKAALETLFMDLNEQKETNALYKKIEKAYKEIIILKKK